MPAADNAPAISWSSPAQPPSPDMRMAKASLGAEPGFAATSTMGRSINALGAGAEWADLLAAESLANAASKGAPCGFANVTLAAPSILPAKAVACAAGQL